MRQKRGGVKNSQLRIGYEEVLVGHQVEQIPVAADEELRLRRYRQIEIRFVVGIPSQTIDPRNLLDLVPFFRESIQEVRHAFIGQSGKRSADLGSVQHIVDFLQGGNAQEEAH